MKNVVAVTTEGKKTVVIGATDKKIAEIVAAAESKGYKAVEVVSEENGKEISRVTVWEAKEESVTIGNKKVIVKIEGTKIFFKGAGIDAVVAIPKDEFKENSRFYWVDGKGSHKYKFEIQETAQKIVMGLM